MSIKTKIVTLVVVSVLVASALVAAISIRFSTETLKDQILEQGRALTLALDSALREPLVVQDTVKVREVVDSYGDMKGVILATALSPDGDILAMAPMDKLPSWLKTYLAKTVEEETPVQGKVVFLKSPSPLVSKGLAYTSLYVIHKAVLGGTAGHVYLAFPTAFAAVVRTQQRLVLMASVAGVAVAILVALVAAIIGAGIARNVLYLADVAERMSLGELDIKVDKRSRDELGRLAEALERMRVSLKAAIERLKKRSL